MDTLLEMATYITFGYIFMEVLGWAARVIRRQGEAFLARKEDAKFFMHFVR
jgi:hypothetical protein